MLDASALNTTVGEFQRNYLYKINIVSFPAALRTAFPGADEFVNNADIYSHKFAIPESSTQPIQIKWAGMWVWFSGPQNPAGNVTMGLRCDRSYQALDFFTAWKNLTGDDATGAALPKPLTVGAWEVLMVDVDKETVLKRFSLGTVQIFKIDAMELDKAGEKELEIQVTLHYERKRTLPGQGTV